MFTDKVVPSMFRRNRSYNVTWNGGFQTQVIESEIEMYPEPILY